MNRFIHRSTRESIIVIPIDVEYGITMTLPLLLDLSIAQFPETDGVVERSSEEHRSERIPFEGKDCSLMHREDEMKIS